MGFYFWILLEYILSSSLQTMSLVANSANPLAVEHVSLGLSSWQIAREKTVCVLNHFLPVLWDQTSFSLSYPCCRWMCDAGLRVIFAINQNFAFWKVRTFYHLHYEISTGKNVNVPFVSLIDIQKFLKRSDVTVSSQGIFPSVNVLSTASLLSLLNSFYTYENILIFLKLFLYLQIFISYFLSIWPLCYFLEKSLLLHSFHEFTPWLCPFNYLAYLTYLVLRLFV